MTKRVFTLFFTALYLVISVGVTVSGHFCGGHLTTYSLTIETKHLDCCCKGAPMKPGCCENKSFSLKTDVKHSATQAIHIERSVQLVATIVPAFGQNEFTHSGNNYETTYYPPPDIPNRPIHIRTRTLLI